MGTEYLDKFFLEAGQEVFTYEYIESLRNDEAKRKKCIIPWGGSQENAIMCSSDFVIYAGVRGVGKSAVLHMGAYYDIENPGFSATIFRKEQNDSNDTGGIADVSKKFFKDFGLYKSSMSNMRWDFNAGGSLKYGYYSDPYKEFTERYRGKEISYIGIDELGQMGFDYLRFLFSNNRNSSNIENKIIGTCNPDGNAWMFRFIGGKYTIKKGDPPRYKWLDETGKPIPEMNGKELYFFIYGDRPDQTFWGRTKEEVVMQGREYIQRMMPPDAKKHGLKEEDFVLSCTFFSGYTTENLSIDSKNYMKRLGALSPDEREKDLVGTWIRSSNNNTLISLNNIDSFFENSYQTGEYRCVTADVAFKEKDLSVLYLWEGFHIRDIEVYMVGSETLKAFIDESLKKWGISEEDFCFDATGSGVGLCERYSDSMQYIANSKAFDQREIEIGKLKQTVSSYENVRAQCIDNFARRFRGSGYSVEESLIYRKYDDKMFADHIREEYIVIARDAKKMDKFKAIEKKEVIAKIGHSPNFMDGMYLREYVELVRKFNQNDVEQIGAYYL